MPQQKHVGTVRLYFATPPVEMLAKAYAGMPRHVSVSLVWKLMSSAHPLVHHGVVGGDPHVGAGRHGAGGHVGQRGDPNRLQGVLAKAVAEHPPVSRALSSGP